MVVNDHTRSAENWKCVWYLLRLYIYIYRVYVDSHSLGQLALASKRTASVCKTIKDPSLIHKNICLLSTHWTLLMCNNTFFLLIT